jgi:hypothetical protein
MTFCKYEFLNAKDWAKYQLQISTIQEGSVVYNNCAVHEIGNIDLSPLYAVDILWNDEPLKSFATKEVFPNPIGVHTFSGCEEMYTQRFCNFNPDSPYCVINKD